MIFDRFRFSPSTCILCGAAGQQGLDLCPGCDDDLPRTSTSCYRCADETPAATELLCGQCLKQTPPMDRTISALRYGPPLGHLITDLKFHQRLVVARILGQLLGSHLERLHVDKPEVIIPVPLHPGRLRERGYNQSLEIARFVARQLNLPIDIKLCQRQRHTSPQSGLSAKERQKNVKQAFALSGPCNYKHIAIVDDVITTGHTVRALSQLFKHNGVKKIQVWSVARAIPD